MMLWDRLFRLSTQGGLTLQQQIRQALVSAILDARLPPDAPLPSGRELAERLGVARNTVMLAYQQLAEEGYVIARSRRGYFVHPDMLPTRVLRAQEEVSSSSRTVEWDRRFAIRPSAQRNIVKPADWQRYAYPFIYGQFDATLFPKQAWRECCMKTLSIMEIRDWAQDMVMRDDESLVEQIRVRVLPRRGVWASQDEIIVTMGAQQALHLIAELLLDAHKAVGMEDPGYPDARNIFASRTRRLVGLPVDECGLKVGGRLRGLDYVYVTPSHQCPTGVTMPLERRKALLRRADEHDFIIIEDDYESENVLAAEPLASLKSLDEAGRVVYVGSLSKSFAPGLRLGYVVGPKELVAELRSLRRLMIRHPASFIQRSFALFLALGHYDALLRRLAGAYDVRGRTMTTAIANHLSGVTLPPARGGSSRWLRGPDGLDARALARAARERGVLIEPGDVFFMNDTPPMNCFRLGFSSIGPERIEEGIAHLGMLMREFTR